jgi:hypothetical protein
MIAGHHHAHHKNHTEITVQDIRAFRALPSNIGRKQSLGRSGVCAVFRENIIGGVVHGVLNVFRAHWDLPLGGSEPRIPAD